MKIRLGVIFGGESVEHEVSIISAIQAMNKMDSEKYEIIPNLIFIIFTPIHYNYQVNHFQIKHISHL